MKSHSKHWALSAFAISLLASATHVCSQTVGNDAGVTLINQKAQDQKIFTFDYGIPTSPALTLAGLPTDTTSTSTSLKPFVLSLPGLFATGSSQSSAALDTSPAWIFGGNEHPNDYEASGNYLGRLSYRTRIGVAMYKGDSGGGDPSKVKGSRLAFGLSASLLDQSDPLVARGNDSMTVWDKCLDTNKKDLQTWIDSSQPVQQLEPLDAEFISLKNSPTPDAARADKAIAAAKAAGVSLADADSQKSLHDKLVAYQAAVATREKDAEAADNSSAAQVEMDKRASDMVDGCKKQASEAAQHGADLDVGLGAVWRGDPGELQNFKDPSGTVWIAGRLPLNFFLKDTKPCEADKASKTSELACWMIGGSGRYARGEYVSTGDTTTPEFRANVIDGWIALERVDSRSKLAFSYGYLDQRATDSTLSRFSKSDWRYLISANYSLDSVVKGLWLEASYGNSQGTVATQNDKVAMLALSFAPPSVPSLTGSK